MTTLKLTGTYNTSGTFSLDIPIDKYDTQKTISEYCINITSKCKTSLEAEDIPWSTTEPKEKNIFQFVGITFSEINDKIKCVLELKTTTSENKFKTLKLVLTEQLGFDSTNNTLEVSTTQKTDTEEAKNKPGDEPKTPIWRLWWFWAIIIGVSLFILTVLAFIIYFVRKGRKSKTSEKEKVAANEPPKEETTTVQ